MKGASITVVKGNNEFEMVISDDDQVEVSNVTPKEKPKRDLSELEKLELKWERENPAGQVVELNTGSYWVLWNYKVARSALKAAHKDALQVDGTIHTAIKIAINTDDQTRIMLIGHASSTGRALFNKDLSRDRANSVKAFMQYTLGIDEERFLIRYYGQDYPWSTEAFSHVGKQLAQSRRTQIYLHYEGKRPPTLPGDLGEPEEEKADKMTRMGAEVAFSKTLHGPKKEFTYVFVQLDAKIEGKIIAKHPEDAGKIQITESGLKEIEVDVDKQVGFDEFAVGLSDDEVAIKLKNYPFEIVWNKEVDPLGPVVKVEVPWKELKGVVKEYPDGTQVMLYGAINMIVYVGSTPKGKQAVLKGGNSLLTKIGSGSAAIGGISLAGGVAGTALLLAATATLVQKAREDGIKKGKFAYSAKGYSLRTAALVFSSNAAHNKAVAQLERIVTDNTALDGKEAYQLAYDGWGKAQHVFATAGFTSQQKSELKSNYGDTFEAMQLRMTTVLGVLGEWENGNLPEDYKELIAAVQN